MRTTSLLGAVLSLSLAAACDGRNVLDSHAQSVVTQAPPPSAPAGGGTLVADAGSAPQKPAEQNPEKQIVVAPDAGTTIIPAVPKACAELAAGGDSGDINGFVWQRQVADGQSSAALDYVSLGYSCGLKYQHADNARVVTMNAADCAAAHAWATNARFLEILRTGDGCPDPADANTKNATESFDVYTRDGQSVSRKTWGCSEPTMDAERACFRALIDRLFL
jgi:hypothetical protein